MLKLNTEKLQLVAVIGWLIFVMSSVTGVFLDAVQKKQIKQVGYDAIRLMNERYFGLYRVVHNADPESAEEVWSEYFESVKKWNTEHHVSYHKLKDVEEKLAEDFKNIHKLFGKVHNPALTLNMCMRDDCSFIENRVKYREDLIGNELHTLREEIDNFSEKLFD